MAGMTLNQRMESAIISATQSVLCDPDQGSSLATLATVAGITRRSPLRDLTAAMFNLQRLIRPNPDQPVT